MNEITGWAYIICIAAIVCVLFELISPNGSMEKTLRFVLGVFMLAAIIIPLGTGVFNTKIDLLKIEPFENNTKEFSQQAQMQLEELGKVSVSELVHGILEKNNIVSEKVEINMDTSEDNSIDIVLVTVYIDQKHKDDKIFIKDTLEKELGLDVQVLTERSENNG